MRLLCASSLRLSSSAKAASCGNPKVRNRTICTSRRPGTFPERKINGWRNSTYQNRRNGLPILEWSKRSKILKPVKAGMEEFADIEGVQGYDPEGLFKNVNQVGGHFARREAERAARLQEAELQRKAEAREIVRLPAHLETEGVPANQDCEGYSVSTMQSLMESEFMPVDLNHPGLRVHCIDPPVLTLDEFWPQDQCQELIDQTVQSEALKSSEVGAHVAGTGSANQLSERRTSSSVLLDINFLRSHKPINQIINALHTRIRDVLTDGSWDPTGWLPSPGRFCFESTQVARYTQGQHFLAHEDAFPIAVAQRDRFQRRATFLLYLNTVPEGGGTHFEELGLTIRPKCGKALLFFPALSSGVSDPRTLHTAEGAVDEKWVTQQWIAGGLTNVGSESATSSTGSQSEVSSNSPASVQKNVEDKKEPVLAFEKKKRTSSSVKKSKKKKNARPAGKGFGK